ncbi:MAG: hypothetical protein DIU72_008830 [Pseudomonadota bacterium]|nr:MAG: hypothetical protein DIU72_11135 [Pseudomonadota bacterium]
MLDAFIIDQLQKERERAERIREDERPRLEIPLPVPEYPVRKPREEEKKAPERGVIVIDL